MASDPSWAAPELSARLLAGVAAAAARQLGRPTVDAAMDAAGLPRSAFEDPAGWVAWEAADAFASALALRAAGDAAPPATHPVWDLWREAARMQEPPREVYGLRVAARALGGAATLYRDVASHYRRLDQVSALELTRVGWGSVTLAARVPEADRPWACRVRSGFLEGLPVAAELGHARVEHPRCLHRGEGACIYLVHLPTLAATLAIGAVGSVAVGLGAWSIAGAPMGAVALSLSVAVLAEVHRAVERRGHHDEAAQLRRLVQQADDRYTALWDERQALRRALRSARKMSAYLGADVAERLSQDVEPVTDVGISVGEAAVLFADIVGFTSRCEREPPERVIADLNTWYTHVDPVIQAHGGSIEKRLGDGMMVVFPSRGDGVDEFHARVVACARGMLAALERCNKVLALRHSAPLSVRIGVASGTLGRGNVGSAIAGERTVIGDTVNTAARLESMATPGRVLLPRAMLPQALAAGARTITLRGKVATVDVVEIGP